MAEPRLIEQAQPGGRKPAPGRLHLVQAFVNTRDIEGGQDALASVDGLASWLRSARLTRGRLPLTATDLARAIELREALRALLRANNGGVADRESRRVLEETAIRARLTLRFAATGRSATLQPSAAGVAGPLGTLLAIAFSAMEDGTWPRLKVCRREACRWAFYDHSNACSSAWCSMAICGNRTKVSRHRARGQGGR
jgi:predicted RNA-binding Zn ribbon-like protein